MVASPNVPHDDYREGYIVGFQIVRGKNAMPPMHTIASPPSLNSTNFLQGVKAGISDAGGPRL